MNNSIESEENTANPILSCPLQDLQLSTRLFNLLKTNSLEIILIEDLIKILRIEQWRIKKMPGMGKTYWHELIKAIAITFEEKENIANGYDSDRKAIWRSVIYKTAQFEGNWHWDHYLNDFIYNKIRGHITTATIYSAPTTKSKFIDNILENKNE